ncbi:MAG: hypothetical protein IE913_03540 [Halothiobacillus sp.]|nr:hypothetical protein [Halothiobacillus sp.]
MPEWGALRAGQIVLEGRMFYDAGPSTLPFWSSEVLWLPIPFANPPLASSHEFLVGFFVLGIHY